MNIEIERKFLVHHGKWKHLNKPAGVLIRQGYLLTNPSKTVRIRTAGQHGFITIKGATTGAARVEFEYEIPVDDAKELFSIFSINLVSKVRCNIFHNGKLWEVDEFLDDNEGLIIAEIELDDEAETFDLPHWIAEEVTGDEKYYNAYLSVNPYKNR